MGATCNTCSTAISEWGQENAEMNMMRDSELQYNGNFKTAANLRRVITLQRNMRMFLAKRRFFRLKDDPLVYALVIPRDDPTCSKFIKVKRADLSQSLRSYRSSAVRHVMAELGDYRFNDEKSLQALAEEGLVSETRDESRVEDDAKYTGEWHGQERHGRGTQIWPNGMRYDGFWIHDEFNGHGRMLYPDGSYYSGEWRDHVREGKGKLVRADKTVYDGDWQQNEQHGQGREEWHDGHFEGQYQNGFRHGQGKFVMFDDSSYEGSFSNNKMEGRGKYSWPNGSCYTGDF